MKIIVAEQLRLTNKINEGDDAEMKILYLVIPCYNEEDVLNETAKQLKKKIKQLIDRKLIDSVSKIVFVNDGSKDKTWDIINELHKEDKIISGINLSRNRGHQNALLAGLMTAKSHADMVISLDADLQDDINAIDEFVEKHYEGYDIVYGVRSARDTDTFFKKFTAESFYKFMKVLGVDIVFNHADYRLMSKRALEDLERFKEVNLFLRGVVPLIGYNSTTVMYERKERFAGESKYPFKKMLGFAFEGITSFTIKPIRMITALGIGIFAMSILMTIYFISIYLMGKAVPGWTTITCSLWAIGGLQLLSIGVVGEYVGKVYLEVKERPKFIVEQFLNDQVGEIYADTRISQVG